MLAKPGFFQNFLAAVLKLKDVKNIEVAGLPLALSLSSWTQVSLLLFFLYKKIGDFRVKEIVDSFVKVLAASSAMAAAVYLVLNISANFLNMQTFFGVLAQAIFAGLAGAAVYFFSASLLGSPEAKTIKSSLLRQIIKTPQL